MAKIAVVSDFSFRGSGYFNIITPLCDELSQENQVIAVGLGYRGEEHRNNYSIIPCATFQDSFAILSNLVYQWGVDAVIVALDIPRQEGYINMVHQANKKIISIVPLENPPLMPTWANLLSKSDKVFFISELGKTEALTAGVSSAVDHLLVGIDSNLWAKRTDDEYRENRKNLNIKEDTLVILTVADNQERKNLSKSMEVVSHVKENKKIKYILVSNEKSEVGWNLRDLALYYGIPSELFIFEKALTQRELRALYSCADVYLSTSKAEGLGMPILEAMSVGVPVVATNCGAMPELLGTNGERGMLLETEYSMIDPWGNSKRTFPSWESAKSSILELEKNKELRDSIISNARDYIERVRNWNFGKLQIVEAVKEVTNE